MFILPSVSSRLQLWSVSRTSIYENSVLKVFKKLNSWVKYLITDQMIY